MALFNTRGVNDCYGATSSFRPGSEMDRSKVSFRLRTALRAARNPFPMGILLDDRIALLVRFLVDRHFVGTRGCRRIVVTWRRDGRWWSERHRRAAAREGLFPRKRRPTSERRRRHRPIDAWSFVPVLHVGSALKTARAFQFPWGREGGVAPAAGGSAIAPSRPFSLMRDGVGIIPGRC
jgi:hypothetical protein